MWPSVLTEAQGWRDALVVVWAEIVWRMGMAACSAATALLMWTWLHQAWLAVLVPVFVVLAIALARLRATGRP